MQQAVLGAASGSAAAAADVSAPQGPGQPDLQEYGPQQSPPPLPLQQQQLAARKSVSPSHDLVHAEQEPQSDAPALPAYAQTKHMQGYSPRWFSAAASCEMAGMGVIALRTRQQQQPGGGSPASPAVRARTAWCSQDWGLFVIVQLAGALESLANPVDGCGLGGCPMSVSLA